MSSLTNANSSHSFATSVFNSLSLTSPIHIVMAHHSINVGIIGGGIGGVAAAVALHRAGIEATVYERAEELREVGAGMMLWPNATRVLKELGVLDRVAALSGPNQHFLVRSSAGSILM